MSEEVKEPTKIRPIPGCVKHAPFPTSYCTECRAMFAAANPDWQGLYPDMRSWGV